MFGKSLDKMKNSNWGFTTFAAQNKLTFHLSSKDIRDNTQPQRFDETHTGEGNQISEDG